MTERETVKAVIIQTDGTVSITDIKPDLETLKGIVGGWIEAIGLANGDHAYLNEEGKIEGLAFNPLGNIVLHVMNPGLQGDDLIVGDVVLLGMDEDGDEADVSTDTINTVSAHKP